MEPTIMHLYIIDIFLNLYWDIIVVSAPLHSW